MDEPHTSSQSHKGRLHLGGPAAGGSRLGMPLQLVHQRLEDAGGGRHKTAVKMYYAKEPLQLLHRCGLRMLQDGGERSW